MASSITDNFRRGLQRFTVQEAQNAKLGNAGMVWIDDTDEHVGPFCAIYVHATAVIDTSECQIGIDDAPATIEFAAKETIYGYFPSIELDSGTVLAYYAGANVDG
tara:strand:- start:9025 stop:9339 length:315 start_codon:yes stop_codon:yes gene_type:complete